MSIDTTYDIPNKTVFIRVIGKFDLAIHSCFRDAIDQIYADMQYIVVDFQLADYIDSSGLGMLLALYEKANQLQQSITLINMNSDMGKTLMVANLNNFFQVQKN